MRAPPPVLPPPDDSPTRYKPTWFDRVGPDAGINLRAFAYSAMAGAIAFVTIVMMAAQGGSASLAAAIPIAFVIAVTLSWAIYYVAVKFMDGVGAVTKSFTLPSGNSTPYEQTFSFQESLAIRGDLAGALESYETIIAENPLAIPPRLKAAEHYARNGRDAKRAAELFREIREIPGCTSRDAVYASSRLVDLYDGPLDDPGRALVELRRIIELHPGTPMANHAREALPGLKARLHGSDESRD